MKEKQLYIIPGFGEYPTDPPYRKIAAYAKKQGYTVIPVPITWERRTPSHWLKQFEEVFKKRKEGNATVLGFSFGAYIALLGSRTLPFKKMILCSLSPYFKEDLKHIPASAKKFFGTRRMSDFQRHATPSIKTQTMFFFGDQDWPMAIRKVRNMVAQSRNLSHFKSVKNVGHDISDSTYLEAVRSEIKNT